jgi:hypothetical protein
MDTLPPHGDLPPPSSPGDTGSVPVRITTVVETTTPQAFLTVAYLAENLAEAELLLSYAAVSGIEIDESVRDGVLEARLASDASKVTEDVAANLLIALTSLAKAVAPVTVGSLRASDDLTGARRTMRIYSTMAGVVGLLIIGISLVTYFSTSVANKIHVEIDMANGLTSKLRSELGPWPADDSAPPVPAPAAGTALVQARVWYGTAATPPNVSDRDVISDLQLFAATMREIDGYTKQLRYFVLDFDAPLHTRPPGSLELQPGLDQRLASELTDKVKEYQAVRTAGNDVMEKVTVYYGAIATCILPVLYSLLGAGAYLLRLYEDQIKNRTLTPSDRHIARFLIAGIGGLVVGLFNNFTNQGITFSPFAIAFLVGYAVDVFFTFLEGLLQIFRRGPGASATAGTGTGTPGA